MFRGFGFSGHTFARAAQKEELIQLSLWPLPDRCCYRYGYARRVADVFDGPIMVQNADMYAPLRGEQVAQLVEEIPQVEYVKEERQPGPKHIAEGAFNGGG